MRTLTHKPGFNPGKFFTCSSRYFAQCFMRQRVSILLDNLLVMLLIAAFNALSHTQTVSLVPWLLIEGLVTIARACTKMIVNLLRKTTLKFIKNKEGMRIVHGQAKTSLSWDRHNYIKSPRKCPFA